MHSLGMLGRRNDTLRPSCAELPCSNSPRRGFREWARMWNSFRAACAAGCCICGCGEERRPHAVPATLSEDRVSAPQIANVVLQRQERPLLWLGCSRTSLGNRCVTCRWQMQIWMFGGGPSGGHSRQVLCGAVVKEVLLTGGRATATPGTHRSILPADAPKSGHRADTPSRGRRGPPDRPHMLCFFPTAVS